MPTPLDKIQKILVTRTDRIGDLVLSTPVFRALRKKYPKAWIAALIFLENKDILLGNPDIDEVLLYDKNGSEKSLFGQLRFANFLSKKKFDWVIHLHATNRMHWLGWLARIPARIGWSRKLGWALTSGFQDVKKEGKKHEAEYNFELLKPLGIETGEPIEAFVPINPKAQLSLESLLSFYHIQKDLPWIVISPSASCPSKRWPYQKFAELITELSKRYTGYFFIIGARQDRFLASQIQALTNSPVMDLTGKLSLGMLSAFLKQAALLISNDSGPAHIAAFQTPVISIFGRKQAGLSPTRWKPLGDQSDIVWKDVGCEVCLAHACQIHFLCLDAISVKDVLEKIKRFESDLNKKKIGCHEVS